VWHPGGAHPFMGMNMALVHNGDFANYHSVSEYLLQRHIYPQFITDTEVSALVFDLLARTYKYPLEHIIEALAPTTELDFDRLPAEKQREYRAVQASHIHGSPDGPWFFIIARNNPAKAAKPLLLNRCTTQRLGGWPNARSRFLDRMCKCFSTPFGCHR